MENLLDSLKGDIQFMLKMQNEYTELNTKLYYIADLKNKRNYNEELAIKMNLKQKEIANILIRLKAKWGI